MSISDTARGIQHDPDMSYPTSVTIQVVWHVDGEPRYATEDISADRFFGHGVYGAPIEPMALVSMIERMRRTGPPPIPKRKNAKTKR